MFIKIIFSVKWAGCSLHSDAGGWQISLCFSCDMYASFTGVASNIYIIIIIIIKGTFFQTFLWGVGIWHAPSMRFVSGWQHYTLILSLSAGIAQKKDHINRGPKLNDMQLTCFPLGKPSFTATVLITCYLVDINFDRYTRAVVVCRLLQTLHNL